MLQRYSRLFVLSLGVSFILAGKSDTDIQRGREEMLHGNYAQAEEAFQAALQDAQGKKNRTGLIAAYASLAQLAELQKRFDQEESYLLNELQARQTLGYPTAVLPAFLDLYRFYGQQRRPKDQIAMLQQIISVWSTAVGSDALGIAQYKYRLGQVYRSIKDTGNAESAFHDALSVLERNGMADSSAAVWVKISLAQTLDAEGKLDEAEAVWASVASKQPQAGEGNSRISNALYSYAEHLRKMGKTAEADALNLPKRDGNKASPENRLTLPGLALKREPEYTDTARKKRISGVVMLTLEVDENGSPQNIQVLEPLGFGLDEKAVEAVSSWLFQPATKDGVRVKQPATVEVTFNLM